MSAFVTRGRARTAMVAALIITALAVGFIFAAPAVHAAPPPKYKVDICKDFNWLNLVHDAIYNPVFSVSGDCNWENAPYDVPFSALGENDGTEEGAWEYPFHTGPHHDGLELTKITTMMYGSDGSADGAYQGLRVCASGCGDLITLSQPSLPSPDDWEQQSYSAGTAQVPDDAYWIRFVGNCVTIPCGPTEPIRFLKIELEYSETAEDSAPRTDVSKRDTIPYTFSRTADFGWVNSPFTFHWRASDVGAGLTQVRWSSTRGGNGTVYDHCKNSIENAYLCPLSASGPLTIDPTSKVVWQEGPQAVVVDATDRVGLKTSSRIDPNERPASVTFSIDRTDPTPTALAVQDKGPTVWTSVASTKLTWSNVGEQGENRSVTAPASGVVAARYDFDPAEAGQPDPPPQTVAGENIEAAYATIPGPGLWTVSVRTIDRVGNESIPMNTVVGLDEIPPGAPQIDPISWVGGPYLIEGKEFRWSMARESKPRSGICGFAQLVDAFADTAAPSEINIDGDVTSSTLPAGMIEGAMYLHLRAISCAGVAGETVHHRLEIDLTPPDVVANHTDGTWVNGEEPLTLSATDNETGVDAIHVAVDGSPATRYPGDVVEPVLAEGWRSIKFRAYDRAANASLEKSVSIGVDRTTPDGRIDEIDPERPTLIAATVTDSHSGIESAVIQYRPTGFAGEWIPLVTRVDRLGHGAARLLARFPDASVPEGAYDVRIDAVDAVGNRGLLATGSQGGVARILTPLRQSSGIDFAFEQRQPSRCARKKQESCTLKFTQSRKTVEFGRGAFVVGRLRDSAGRPLTNTKVKLYISRGGPLQRRELGEIVTGRDGRFRSFVPAGTNRLVTARFAGNELIKPFEVTIEMFTKAKIGIRVNRKRIRSGQRFVIRGRLATGGEKIGALDLPMAVRVLGTKLSFPTAVRKDGTYRAISDRISTRRPIRLRLQAEFPHQAGWPYAAGKSRVLRVVVVP